MSLRFLPVCVLALVSAAAPLAAQQGTSSIRGQVTDPSGAAVARARVSITSPETSRSRVTRTDARGFYAAPALPAGRYEVAVEASGFSKFRRLGIVMAVGEQARIDFRLRIGDLSG